MNKNLYLSFLLLPILVGCSILNNSSNPPSIDKCNLNPNLPSPTTPLQSCEDKSLDGWGSLEGNSPTMAINTVQRAATQDKRYQGVPVFVNGGLGYAQAGQNIHEVTYKNLKFTVQLSKGVQFMGIQPGDYFTQSADPNIQISCTPHADGTVDVEINSKAPCETINNADGTKTLLDLVLSINNDSGQTETARITSAQAEYTYDITARPVNSTISNCTSSEDPKICKFDQVNGSVNVPTKLTRPSFLDPTYSIALSAPNGGSVKVGKDIWVSAKLTRPNNGYSLQGQTLAMAYDPTKLDYLGSQPGCLFTATCVGLDPSVMGTGSTFPISTSIGDGIHYSEFIPAAVVPKLGWEGFELIKIVIGPSTMTAGGEVDLYHFRGKSSGATSIDLSRAELIINTGAGSQKGFDAPTKGIDINVVP